MTVRGAWFAVRGAGCAKCGNQGYRGRIGLYEMLRMSPTLKKAVERGEPAVSIRELAIGEGMREMWQDGLEKARLGLTTLDEVATTVAIQATEEGSARTSTIGPPPMRAAA